MLAYYRKAVAGLLAALATWGGTALADGDISGVEWFGMLGALAAVLGVGALPNGPAPVPGVGAAGWDEVDGEAGLTLIELLVGGLVLIVVFLLLVGYRR